MTHGPSSTVRFSKWLIGNIKQGHGGGLALHFRIGGDQSARRTVGGRATPLARRARLAAGRGAERTTKRFPSCSISVSVSESRSARISGQAPRRGPVTARLG